MARKRRAPKYIGALAQPIYVDDYHKHGGLLYQPEPNIAAIRKRMFETMQLLFKHYGIDPGGEQSWQGLAMSLAFDHVPGLQLANRPKPGRKPTWKTGLGDELVRAVEDARSRTGKGTEDAIAMLKNERGGRWRRYTLQSLGARYREARRWQKTLVSVREAWENQLAQVIAHMAPSATPPPAWQREMTGLPTKIGARAKTSRRK
jgi:hypothetical protein